MKKPDKRRVVRIKEKSYNLLLEIQKVYERNIGIKPTLTQIIDLSLNELMRNKLTSPETSGKVSK